MSSIVKFDVLDVLTWKDTFLALTMSVPKVGSASDLFCGPDSALGKVHLQALIEPYNISSSPEEQRPQKRIAQ